MRIGRHRARWATAIAAALVGAATPQDVAADGLLPESVEGRAERGATWRERGGWQVSPARALTGGGTRVAGLVEDGAESGAGPRIQARGVGRSGGAGPWVDTLTTFRQPGRAVVVADLGGRWPSAQVRVPSSVAWGPATVAWEFLDPAFPEAGARARAPGAAAEVATALSTVQATIGVIDRETWGARPTTCTSPETDWYRMAIHHTAGSQTYSGSVQGTVQLLQAYAQDSGEYCDIPYQFLVGYDGSLWEGRPLTYYSGATGGDNNDGNIATCFLGCYHPSGCPSDGGDEVTEAMMSAAHLLVQVLVAEHTIPSDSDSIRGHRDWPGNATACPGDRVYTRLDELRAGMPLFQGTLQAHSFPQVAPEALTIAPGGVLDGWIDVLNSGSIPWVPAVTHLAVIPREGTSPLYDPSWPSTTRPATVSASTSPGAVGRFAFRLAGTTEGEFDLAFGLVEEGITWFADGPFGSGPADGFVSLHVVVGEVPPADDDTAPPADDDTTADDDDTSPGGDDDTGPGDDDTPGGGQSNGTGWEREWRVPQGCGCGVGEPRGARRPVPAVAWTGVVALGWTLRRRGGRACRGRERPPDAPAGP